MRKEVAKTGLPCHPRIGKPELGEVFYDFVVSFEKTFLDERGGDDSRPEADRQGEIAINIERF
jgi:hypothetical protein